MEVRFASSPQAVKCMDTQELRREFLLEGLFEADSIPLVYSHIDRIIAGSAVPVKGALQLSAGSELRAQYFLERRELGLINIGGPGLVVVAGHEYSLRPRDGMYIGRGSKEVSFHSKDQQNPAKYYLNSAPAHKEYPTVLIKPEECENVELGTLEESNHRVICKYIRP